MRSWLLVLLVAVFHAPAVAAQPPPEGQAAAAAGQERPVPEVRWPVSLDKIWKELQEAPPPPAPPLRIGELPTFRVTVYGQRKPLLPDFSASLKQEWQPVVAGGIHNKEIMDMLTPPQARAFGQSVDGELLEVAGTALINEVIERGIIKSYQAVRRGLRNYQEGRIREQVAAELAAFILANPQPPPEKKVDEKR
jgi:hypothetical protein